MLQFFAHEGYQTPFEASTEPKLLYVSRAVGQNVANYPRAMHRHEAWFEMILVSGGSGQVLIGESVFQVEKGDVLLYNAGILHDESQSELGFERLCLGISGLNIEGLPQNHLISMNVRPIVSVDSDFESVYRIWNTIFDLLSNKKPNAEAISHYLMLSLLAYVQDRVKSAGGFAENNNAGEYRMGISVRKFLDEHYTEPITLPDIGQAMNLSIYYMSHIFKKVTGYAPMQYIAKRRIGEAQEKLIHTKLSITEIALSVGYNSVSSFNYAFSKFAGMSPSQFRKTYSGAAFRHQ